MEKRRNILLCLSWYHPKIHRGIADFAKANNWHLNTELTRSSSMIPYGWDGDGIICSGNFCSEEQREFIWNLKQPKVILSHNFEKFPDFITVSDDHEAIADMSAAHLLKNNFRRFAVFCPKNALIGIRINRFVKQIRKSGFEPEFLVPPDHISDWRARRVWLVEALKNLSKPVAIFAQNDEFAAEVVEACMDAQIDIPEEVAVCGVRNDELICETLNVPLSSVDNNLYGIGYKAAEELEKVLSGSEPEVRHYNMPPLGVVERQSTDIIAVSEDNENLRRAIRYIRENYQNRALKVEDVAEAAAMSKRKLYMEFERELGKTPLKEILRLRLNKACELLKENRITTEEIADISGFRSMRNFYSAFKKELNSTPGDFRG